MANNFSLPGVQRMSFADFMNNNNYMQEPSSSPSLSPDSLEQPSFTLNGLRADRALGSSVEPTIPSNFSQNPEGQAGSFLGNIEIGPKPVAGAGTAETTQKKPLLTRIMESVKGSTGRRTEGKKPTSVFSGETEIIGGLKADEFATLAGSLAHAIAPDTPQGRMGAAVANIASRDLESRRKYELEKPEKELARRLTEAKIADLEKSDDPKTAMAWYLKNNPSASIDDVTAFKKSLESDTAGSYWRTTSDDGTVSIYKGGDLIHQSAAGVGQTADKKLYATQEKGFVPAEEAKGLRKAGAEATPVSWTTATKSLSSRFGKQDAMGNVIITPDLQHAHRVAQKKLVDLQESGLDPLDAINKAEDYARHVEDRYWQYYQLITKKLDGEQRKKKLDSLSKTFKSNYGYIPRIQR